MSSDAYKETELGLIPSDWDIIRLNGIGKIITGSTPKTSNQEYYLNGTRLWASPSDLGKTRYIKTTNTKLSKLGFEKIRVLEKQSILITCIGSTIGKVGIACQNMSSNQQINAITCNKDNSSDFYYYVLFNIKDKIKKLAGIQAVPLLNKTDFSCIKVINPPLKEQDKIASILSTADDKIDAIGLAIDKTERLKKGLLQKLLTNGLGHTEFKETELGLIPSDWDIMSLSEIGSFSKGKGIAKGEVIAAGIPCMRYAEIYTKYNIVLKNIKSFINEKSALNSKRIHRGDILFAGSGETLDDIGKSVTFIYDFEIYVGGDTIVLSPSIKCNSFFMSFQLNSAYVRTQLRKLGQGNSVVHIYSSGLEKVLTLLPPLKEQEKIASILSTADDKIEVLKAKKEQYQALKKGLLQKLLTGQIRVKV